MSEISSARNRNAEWKDLEPPSLSATRVSNPRVTGLQRREASSVPSAHRIRVRRWRHAPLLLVAWALSSSACSAPPPSNAPLFGTGTFHPPPKPGDSISHTQMCACKSCDPVGCCEGPDDDEPAPTKCGDSYDFSANPECGGISVRSCTSRCTQEIWRVRAGSDCSEKRPQSCCQAG